MFSVGILYSAREFLELIHSDPGIDLRFPDVFNTFSVASPKAILEISQKCEWVQLDLNGHLIVTDRGNELLQAKQPELALRIQLGHVIETYLPPWIPLLLRGRSEAIKYLKPDVLQCLKEADLLNSFSDDVVNWWDKYSKLSRKINKDNKLELGRTGEKLSLNHERERTQHEPYWKGFESNFSGFDILSVVDKDNLTPLRIEVKCSNSHINSASFHVTKNEWEVATTSDNYIFYLWALLPKPTLIKVNVPDVQKHMPHNQGEGIWENVSIPFSAFI